VIIVCIDLNVPWFYCSDHIYELLLRLLLAKKSCSSACTSTTLLLVPHSPNITSAQGNCIEQLEKEQNTEIGL
jgi:hypothetical protein